jgi:hypothetical protein
MTIKRFVREVPNSTQRGVAFTQQEFSVFYRKKSDAPRRVHRYLPHIYLEISKIGLAYIHVEWIS